jgi:hypothetical protein
VPIFGTSWFVQLAGGKSFIEKAQKIKRIKIEVVRLNLERYFSLYPIGRLEFLRISLDTGARLSGF